GRQRRGAANTAGGRCISAASDVAINTAAVGTSNRPGREQPGRQDAVYPRLRRDSATLGSRTRSGLAGLAAARAGNLDTGSVPSERTARDDHGKNNRAVGCSDREASARVVGRNDL